MTLNEDKHQYMVEKVHLKFQQGLNEFVALCEFCNCKLEGSLRLSRFGNAYAITTGGEFHHDAEGKLHLYCRLCHKRIHDWGVIQRWLKKVGKTVDDLPDASKLQPIMKTGWN